jgi:hypothetical protein
MKFHLFGTYRFLPFSFLNPPSPRHTGREPGAAATPRGLARARVRAPLLRQALAPPPLASLGLGQRETSLPPAPPFAVETS